MAWSRSISASAASSEAELPLAPCRPNLALAAVRPVPDAVNTTPAAVGHSCRFHFASFAYQVDGSNTNRGDGITAEEALHSIAPSGLRNTILSCLSPAVGGQLALLARQLLVWAQAS